MRILHVANFNTHKYGTDLYATDRKISAGLIRNGHFVYDFSYRDICRNESMWRTTKLGNKKVNRRLVEACDNLHPDLLLLGHSELIEARTLALVRSRRPRMKVALWYVDALFHAQKMHHVEERLPHIDMLFATTSGPYLAAYARETTIAAFIPNPVDSGVETGRAFARQTYNHDFIFCGRDSNDPERQAFMTRLQQDTVQRLRSGFRGCLGQPPLTGAAYLDFLGSAKMGLNISRRNDVELYSSDRIAQLLGNGLLTFCPRVPGFDRLFTEEEIVYFDTIDDLLEKIFYYHKHDTERRTIAEKGWKKVHAACSSERVTRYMLELLFHQRSSSDYEWRDEVFQAETTEE